MAVTQATTLADFTSGIGTAGAVLQVDNENQRIGIGTTNPQSLLQVGDDIKMGGGIITATTFDGALSSFTGKFTSTGIGVSVSNGTASTATIAAPANLIIDPGVVGDDTGLVRIKGNLFVDGTTTQINSTTLEIADFVVGIASTATTDLLTDGAGIKIGPDNTFLYEHNGGTNPSLKSSENLNVATGKVYQIGETDVLSATTLGSAVVNSSLTSVGTLSALTVGGGNVSIASTLTAYSISNADKYFRAGRNDIVNIHTNGIGVGATGSVHAIKVFAQAPNTASTVYGAYLEARFGTGQSSYGVYAKGKVSSSNTSCFGLFGEASVQAGAIHALGNAAGVKGLISNYTGPGSTANTIAVMADNQSDSGAESWAFLGKTISGASIVTPIELFHDNVSIFSVIDSGGVGIADSIFHLGDTNTQIRFPAADTFSVETGGSEALRIDSSGRVLIGTTDEGHTSAQNLTVGNNTSGHSGITIRSSPSYIGSLFFSDATSSPAEYSGFLQYSHNGNFLTLGTDTTEKLRITSAGNVGIGLTNPTQKLTIAGNTQVENATFKVVAASPNIILSVPGGGIDSRIYNDGSGNFIIGHGTNSDAPPEKLRITTDGKVGVGTANPVGNLEVRDTKANLIVAKDGLTVKSNSDLHTSYDLIQLGAGGALASYSVETVTADTQLVHNAYRHSGGTQKYRYADTAMRLRMNSPGGTFIFENAASGSADADITFTERLRIDSAGAKITGDITANAFIFSDDYPTSTPVLDLNFAREKRLDSRITFTRNSVATYFDAESSEVLEENNMDYSSNFSQWTTAGGTLSNSSWARPIPGWDTRQVTLFTEATNSGTHRIYRGFANRYYDNDQLNKVYTISFFAKYSSRQYLQLNASGLNYNARIIFDIQNGYVSDYASALSAGVIDHGNDWYRCWATVQADTVSPVNTTITCPVGGNSTRSGNGESYTGNGSSFYLWGYQVEFSDTLGPYVQTNGKTFRKLGPVIRTAAIDEPRFVYDPSTKESLGLLIEQEATNEQPYTNNLTSAIATNGVTASISYWSDIAAAPNGKLEAGRVKGSGTNDNQRLGFTYGIADGEDGAFSAFLKADPNNSGDIIVHLYTNTFIAGNSAFNVNLNDGTSNVVGGTSDLFTKVEPYPDGWYRVTMGGTSSGSTNGSMNINIADSLDDARVANSDSSNAYFIWGVQFETGSLNDATSYIENTSTGTKTRSAELAEVRGSNFSSWFNNTEGTILAEYRGGQLTSEIPVHISDESYRNNTSIQISSSSSGPISGYVTVGSINNRGTSEAFFQANTAYPTEGESIKTALTYKHNYAQMVTTDGSGTYTGTVDTDVDLPWLNMMTIGKDSYYGIWNNNPIKRLAFYGNTLTEAQLQNIVKY